MIQTVSDQPELVTTMTVTPPTNGEWVVIKVGDYATIAPPMRSPVEQQKKAVRVTFVTIWLMIAGCLAAAWWWL